METQAQEESQKEYQSERAKIDAAIAEKKAEGGDEEAKKAEEIEAMKEDDWIYDYTRAIILAHCSKVA